MIKFLLVMFLLFILLVVLLGFSLIRSVRNVFFGGGDRKQASSGAGPAGSGRREHKASSGRTSGHASHGRSPIRRKKKIFGKDEGEYVDYEEIKE